MRLYIDFETFWSPSLSLRNNGSARCLADESAGINCVGYAIGDGPVHVVDYWQSQTPSRGGFAQALEQATEIVAHYAAFEMSCLQRFNIPINPAAKWSDTAARAAYYGYPRDLDGAAKALGCPVLKDIQGAAAMKKLVSGKFTPETAPADFDRLYHYNRVDIEAMREVDKRLPELPPEVYERWQVDTEINFRGVPIDARACANAINLKAVFDVENDKRMQGLSGGHVQTVNQTEKIAEFAAQYGVNMVDCRADTVEKLLAGELPQAVRSVLQLRRETGLLSLSKYKKILDYQVGGRLHHMFTWYGAHTGRPTGSGPQVMNLARSEDPEAWAEILHSVPSFFLQLDRPSEKLKESVRGVVCAPTLDEELVWIDLAQIEARATGWLAGCDSFLKLFTLGDPYCTYGETIFQRKITKKDNPIERTAAKASLLSLGFAGGIGAYQRVAENYKIEFSLVAQAVLPTATPFEWNEGKRNYEYYREKMPPKPLSEAEGVACDVLKQRYRRDFVEITNYWDALEQAFLMGGQAKRLSVELRPGGLRILTLPSGRQLFYHGVQVHRDGSYSYMTDDGRRNLWKGVLIENAAQAVNADISDWYKVKANREIAPVVHHCYDEFTMQVKVAQRDEAIAKLNQLVKSERPTWAEGLPLGFDINHGRRYGK